MKKLVLISFIAMREKYLPAIGGLSIFDEVFDISPLLHPADHKLHASYKDLPAEVVQIEDYAQLERLIANISTSHVVIHRPYFTSNSLKIIRDLLKRSARLDLICNKSSLLLFDRKKSLKYKVFSEIFCRAKFPSAWPIHTVYTNSLWMNAPLLKYFKPRKVVRVKHFDAIEQVESAKENYGVFLDSFLPFHPELEAEWPSEVDGEAFYKEVDSFIYWAKEQYKLDKVYFCQHPNSDDREKPYIASADVVYGETRRLISKAKYAFSFASDSTLLATQAGCTLICLNLPELLPSRIQQQVEKVARINGADYISFAARADKVEKAAGGATRRRAIRKVYASEAPSVAEAVSKEFRQ